MDRRALMAVGMVGGTLGTAIGIGGGVLMAPMLTILCRFSLATATAVSVASIVVASGFGSLTESLAPVINGHGFGGNIQWGMVLVLATGALAGVRLGMLVREKVQERWLTWIFGAVLLVSALKLGGAFTFLGAGNQAVFDAMFEAGNGSVGGAGYLATKYALSLLVGMVGGMSVPLFGLGGGVVYVPALAILFREFGTAQVARGTSMAAVFLNSAFATWLIWRKGLLPVEILKRVLPGSVVGAVLGVVFANTVDSGLLKIVISCVIAYAAIQMVFNVERRVRRGAVAE